MEHSGHLVTFKYADGAGVPMTAVTFTHACRQGGPSRLPITWDRVHGGGRVECPMCGKSKLTAGLRGHVL